MRPIDADALMHELGFDEKDFVPVQSNAKSTVDIVLMLTKYAINNSPTVTFDDVRLRGEWVPLDNRYSTCSNCHTARNIESQYGWNFCPNCGADMRGGGEDA